MKTPTKRRNRPRRKFSIASAHQRTSAPGAWVSGTIEGYEFEALVFAEHADDASYEIGRSRISKCSIRRRTDGRLVYNWDRGLDIPPADADVQAALEYLLAEVPERADRLFDW